MIQNPTGHENSATLTGWLYLQGTVKFFDWSELRDILTGISQLHF